GFAIAGSGSGSVVDDVVLTQSIAFPFSVTMVYQNPNTSSLLGSFRWDSFNSNTAGIWTQGTTFGLIDSAGSYWASWTSAAHALGAWVTVTYICAAASGGNAIAYLNGVSQGSVSTSGTLNPINRLGLSSNSSFYWPGTYGALLIHPYVLSATDAC